MDAVHFQLQNAMADDAESIISEDSNKELQYNQKVSVKLPGPGKKILLDFDDVRKIKTECEKAMENKFPWAEVCLGLASLFIGAFLSALISQVSYELKFLSILFYTISPTLGIGCGVAYFFFRNIDVYSVKQLAEKIEDYIDIIDDEGV